MTETISVPMARTSHEATVPAQAKKWDAGYDLTTIETKVLRPGQRVTYNTGVVAAIPEGYAGFIMPRSGLAFRHGIDVLAGVIDAGFRDEIKVILLNTGDRAVTFEAGDRIAQLVVQPVASVEFTDVRSVHELSVSERAAAGFGSTGLR